MVKEGLLSQKRQELQEALIAAATRTIAEKGYRSLRARDLAAEVGCAVGAIYNVFPDLDALILAVQARTLDAVDSAVFAKLGPDHSQTPEEGEARLIALAQVYIDFANENRRLWFSAFEHSSPDTPSQEAYMVRLDAILSSVERPLTRMLPNLAPDQRRLIAQALFSAVHGVVALGLDHKHWTVSLAELRWEVQIVLSATLRGLQALAAKREA